MWSDFFLTCCSQGKEWYLEIFKSPIPRQLGKLPLLDSDHVIWWTAPEKLLDGSLSCCFQVQDWTLNLSDRFIFLDVQTVRSATQYPSCSSPYLPTDGTLCHTWALTHSTDLCSHQDPRVSFQTQTVRYFIPFLCGSVLQHSALQGCTTPPPRKVLATVYHWLYWEHVMAQSWWIRWAVDLLITVLG